MAFECLETDSVPWEFLHDSGSGFDGDALGEETLKASFRLQQTGFRRKVQWSGVAMWRQGRDYRYRPKVVFANLWIGGLMSLSSVIHNHHDHDIIVYVTMSPSIPCSDHALSLMIFTLSKIYIKNIRVDFKPYACGPIIFYT